MSTRFSKLHVWSPGNAQCSWSGRLVTNLIPEMRNKHENGQQNSSPDLRGRNMLLIYDVGSFNAPPLGPIFILVYWKNKFRKTIVEIRLILLGLLAFHIVVWSDEIRLKKVEATGKYNSVKLKLSFTVQICTLNRSPFYKISHQIAYF